MADDKFDRGKIIDFKSAKENIKKNRNPIPTKPTPYKIDPWMILRACGGPPFVALLFLLAAVSGFIILIGLMEGEVKSGEIGKIWEHCILLGAVISGSTYYIADSTMKPIPRWSDSAYSLFFVFSFSIYLLFFLSIALINNFLVPSIFTVLFMAIVVPILCLRRMLKPLDDTMIKNEYLRISFVWVAAYMSIIAVFGHFIHILISKYYGDPISMALHAGRLLFFLFIGVVALTMSVKSEFSTSISKLSIVTIAYFVFLIIFQPQIQPIVDYKFVHYVYSVIPLPLLLGWSIIIQKNIYSEKILVFSILFVFVISFAWVSSEL